MNQVNGSGLILPNTPSLSSEIRARELACKFLDVGVGYDNREMLAALAVAAGSTIRARYPLNERDSALTVTVNIMKHAADQR